MLAVILSWKVEEIFCGRNMAVIVDLKYSSKVLKNFTVCVVGNMARHF
jgi:hypothetical protein